MHSTSIERQTAGPIIEDRELAIAFGKNLTDTSWKNDYMTWDEFAAKLRNIRRTSETMDQYSKMTKAQKDRVKNGFAFVGGLVRGGRRKKENVDTRSLITLDVDHADDGFLFAVELVLGGSAYVIYSTHSHRPDKPKYRLIVPPSRDMPPDEHAAVSRKLAEQIGMEYFDKTTFDVNRLMYLPSCSKDAEPVLEVYEGEALDVDKLLNEYEDWRDTSQWSRHPSEAGDVAKARGKLQDSREKDGLVGFFNRAYTLELAMEEHIPGVYLPTDHADRWTYAAGTSYGGMRTYPDGHMYSEHQSDPANTGHCHNAYDMVRIHKFGHMDEGVNKHTEKLKYPSQIAMRAYAAADKLVRELALEEEYGDLDDLDGPVDGSENDESDGEWVQQLETDKKDPRKILSTSANVEIILKNGPFRNVLAYDEFLNSEVIRRRLPWRERKRLDTDYEPWLGDDDSRMQHYFGKVYKMHSKAVIMNAFKEVTHQREFHPVKEYLLEQVWDGVKRLDTLFIVYLGAEDSPYVRAVTRKMFVAAVARVFNPGCKFDYMLVLAGRQGAGKSTILAKMGRQWFSDSLKTFDSKDAGEHMQSAWIFEIAELAVMKKAAVEEIKAFITKPSDKYRVAFDRVVSDFPRKCVFFGTANNRDFLKDATGNRRFWPVDIDPDKRTKNVFTDLTEHEVGQIWAEALHYQRKGESLHLTKELEDIAFTVQAEHMEEDPRSGMIAEYLEKPLSEDWLELGEYERRNYLDMPTGDIKRTRVCAAEIWVECLGKKFGDMDPWDAKQVCDIVRRIPGWRERIPSQTRFQFYGRQKTFERMS